LKRKSHFHAWWHLFLVAIALVDLGIHQKNNTNHGDTSRVPDTLAVPEGLPSAASIAEFFSIPA
jgi:hypothetical protein